MRALTTDIWEEAATEQLAVASKQGQTTSEKLQWQGWAQQKISDLPFVGGC
jgi:hypothetical protein